MKLSIIGAGNVGSTIAERVLKANLAHIVLLDIASELARGKALDLSDASPLMGYKNSIVGTGDYGKTRNSEIVVVTAGLPRKPGMSREDLIGKNVEIVKEVLKNIKKTSPDAILIIVTNPLDIMTFLAYELMGCDSKKVIGMAGSLDTARYKMILSEKCDTPTEKIEAFVLGSHGDTMVPLVSRTLINGKPLKSVLSDKDINTLIARTKKRGGEIVGFLKSGSAYYSPSAACFEILKAIIKDEKKIIPCSCVLQGEYGIDNCAIGVPAQIGAGGVEKIIEWDLTKGELEALKKCADVIKAAINKLGDKQCKKQTG